MAQLVRFKFTLASLIALLSFSLVSESYGQPLSDDWRDWLGFAPTNLLDLHWYRLFTSLLLTAGGWKFIASVGMLAFAVGVAEASFGARQTAKLFFITHVAVLVTISLVVLAVTQCSEVRWASLLASSRDIGPSAGYYGCLGAIVMLLPRIAKTLSLVTIFLMLIFRLVISISRLEEDPSVVSADVAHLVAFPFGILLSTGVRHRVPLASALENQHSGS